jgi:hypothetical protein
VIVDIPYVVGKKLLKTICSESWPKTIITEITKIVVSICEKDNFDNGIKMVYAVPSESIK